MTNNDEITIDPETTFSFQVTEGTVPDLRMASSISAWLQSNLAGLTDYNGNVIFSKIRPVNVCNPCRVYRSSILDCCVIYNV